VIYIGQSLRRESGRIKGAISSFFGRSYLF